MPEPHPQDPRDLAAALRRELARRQRLTAALDEVLQKLAEAETEPAAPAPSDAEKPRIKLPTGGPSMQQMAGVVFAKASGGERTAPSGRRQETEITDPMDLDALQKGHRAHRARERRQRRASRARYSLPAALAILLPLLTGLYLGTSKLDGAGRARPVTPRAHLSPLLPPAPPRTVAAALPKRPQRRPRRIVPDADPGIEIVPVWPEAETARHVANGPSTRTIRSRAPRPRAVYTVQPALPVDTDPAVEAPTEAATNRHPAPGNRRPERSGIEPTHVPIREEWPTARQERHRASPHLPYGNYDDPAVASEATAEETRGGGDTREAIREHRSAGRTTVRICVETGLLATSWCPHTALLNVREDQAPTRHCRLHREP